MSTTTTPLAEGQTVTAVDDTLAATEDTVVRFAASLLLGNDLFFGLASDFLIASVASGIGGTTTLNPDGSVTFAPNHDFNGTATFTYIARSAVLRDVDITTLAPNQGAILRGSEGDYAGWSVSGAGDFNGDGFSDVIVGAPRGD